MAQIYCLRFVEIMQRQQPEEHRAVILLVGNHQVEVGFTISPATLLFLTIEAETPQIHRKIVQVQAFVFRAFTSPSSPIHPSMRGISYR